MLFSLSENKLASLKAKLVRNSAHSLTGVRCRATSVAKKQFVLIYFLSELDFTVWFKADADTVSASQPYFSKEWAIGRGVRRWR